MDRVTAFEAGAVLAEINGKLTRYTKEFGRPSLIDWWVYDNLANMDLDQYIMINPLDDILIDYLQDSVGFTMEFGADALDESILDYLVEKGHIKHVDDMEEEWDDEEDEDEDADE